MLDCFPTKLLVLTVEIGHIVTLRVPTLAVVEAEVDGTAVSQLASSASHFVRDGELVLRGIWSKQGKTNCFCIIFSVLLVNLPACLNYLY
jgi:hypothetical protein